MAEDVDEAKPDKRIKPQINVMSECMKSIINQILQNISQVDQRTLNPASNPTQILVTLAACHGCFFPAFRHCSIIPRSDSIPPLFWDINLGLR